MQDFVFLKSNGDYFRVHYSEIQYIEAVDKYVRVVTARKSYLLLHTMCEVEQFLPNSLFCRIHRSFIVSLQQTMRFNNETVYLTDKALPIGKHYKGVLQAKVTV